MIVPEQDRVKADVILTYCFTAFSEPNIIKLTVT